MQGRISATAIKSSSPTACCCIHREDIQGITCQNLTDIPALENPCDNCGAAEALPNSNVCGACEKAMHGDAQGAMMDISAEH